MAPAISTRTRGTRRSGIRRCLVDLHTASPGGGSWPGGAVAAMTGHRTHDGRRRGRSRRADDRDHGSDGVVAPFAPDAVSVGVRHVQLGPEQWVATLVVTGYPRDVHAGWLAPFTHYPGRLDVCLHITPIDPATAASRLRRQLARLESGRRSDTEHGRLLDPHTDAATEDAYDLADRVARGEGRLFQVGLSLTVHAASPTELAERVADVRALAASMLIDAHPTPYRALPAGSPACRSGWTGSASTAPSTPTRWPPRSRSPPPNSPPQPPHTAPAPPTAPTSPAPPPPRSAQRSAPRRHRRVGCSTATTSGSRSLVFWDRFACDNYNSVILGRSGAGKSYLVKLELLRSLYRGVEAHVIDPEDEYTRLAHAVGGAVITPGAPGVHAQPVRPADHRARRATHRAAGRVDPPRAVPAHLPHRPARRAAHRDRPGRARHRHHRHLHRRRDHRRPPHLGPPGAAAGRPARHPHRHRRPRRRTPATAHDEAGPRPRRPGAQGQRRRSGPWPAAAARLAALLHPFTDGAFAGLFARPTSTSPDAHLVVWSLRELPEPLRPVGTLLALDAIWTRVTDPADRRPRLVVVDEAWLLLQQPAGAAVPAARGQVRAQTLGRADRRHPGHRRRPGHRSRAGGGHQRRHPDPAAPSPASHRRRRRHLRPVRRGTSVPAVRRPRPRAALPPARTGSASRPSPPTPNTS